MSWIEKYRIEKSEDIVGNKYMIEEIENWLNAYNNEIKTSKTKKKNDKYVERGMVIIGNSGLGKTSIVRTVLDKFGYRVMYQNGSDMANMENIFHVIDYGNKGMRQRCINETTIKPIAVVIDEIEGLGNSDEVNIRVLNKLINPNGMRKTNRSPLTKFNVPIICIANNDDDKNVKTLQKICRFVHVELPTYQVIEKFVTKINRLEEIKLSRTEIEQYSRITVYDFRKILIFLQYIKFLKQSSISFNIVDEFRRYGNINATKELRILVATLIEKGNVDRDEVWRKYNKYKTQFSIILHENYPKMRFDIDRFKKISDRLVVGDMIDKIIFSNQRWDLRHTHCDETIYSVIKDLDFSTRFKITNQISLRKYNRVNTVRKNSRNDFLKTYTEDDSED